MGWKLEVFKMTLYMTFPVSAYYLFNRPDLFERSYIAEAKRQRERYDSISTKDIKEQRRMARDKERRQQEEELERQEKLYEEKLSSLKQSPPV